MLHYLGVIDWMYVLMYPNVVFMLFAVFTTASVPRSICVDILEHMSVNAVRASLRSSFVSSAPFLMERKHSSRSLAPPLLRALSSGAVFTDGVADAACVGTWVCVCWGVVNSAAGVEGGRKVVDVGGAGVEGGSKPGAGGGAGAESGGKPGAGAKGGGKPSAGGGVGVCGTSDLSSAWCGGADPTSRV